MSCLQPPAMTPHKQNSKDSPGAEESELKFSFTTSRGWKQVYKKDRIMPLWRYPGLGNLWRPSSEICAVREWRLQVELRWLVSWPEDRMCWVIWVGPRHPDSPQGGRGSEAMLLALKMEEGPQSKEDGWPLAAGKGQGGDFPLEPPGRHVDLLTLCSLTW